MTDCKISVTLYLKEAEALVAYYWRRVAAISETEANFHTHSTQYTLDKIGEARQILDSIESLCNEIMSREK